MNAERLVSTGELVAATRDGKDSSLLVRGRLSDVPSIRLAPGQTLVAPTTTLPLYLRRIRTDCN